MVIAIVWSVSSYIFQHRLDIVIKIRSGITGIVNDVPAKEDSETNHDIAVLSLLETAFNINLKFNHDKIQLKTRECKFLVNF